MSDTTADRLPKAALTFLSDLRDNNDKAWFDQNRKRCAAELIEPLRALVRGFCEEIPRLSPHFIGSDKKAGGSLMRLHRDVRFSKDKSPYNSHVGLHFWHGDAKKRELPGFFLRIDPEVEDELFHPFRTTKADGTGLGLAISQSIMKAHGGEITVGVGPRGGACFRVVLPTTPDNVEAAKD